MAWAWRFENSDAVALDDGELPAESFPTQADAETWIGEAWRELAAAGVAQVTLFEDGREVYGPMSLSE
ncbi:MAG TPA: hypothetical protein VG899_11305 [Mycobacteriales bacterium]|nr:hypothetical protein [Mycobacteriales bacterium]